MPKTRDESFDIMKGFLILMVIVGHLRTGRLGLLVYSFHLPIFFMIAGYFFRQRNLELELRTDFRRLLLPYIFTSFVIIVIACTRCFLFGTDELFEKVLCVLWGSGKITRNQIFGYYLWTSPIWFLYAMFWARIIFSYIVKIHRLSFAFFVSLALSIIAININNLVDIPFSLLPGICAASFMLAGHLIREKQLLLKKTNIIPFCIICWFVMISVAGKTDVNFCKYPGFFIIDLLGSLGAFFIIYAVIDSFSKKEWFQDSIWRKILVFLGRYCLVILAIHSIEFVYLQDFWRATIASIRFNIFVGDFAQVFVFALRLLLILSCTYFVSKANFLKEKIFGIK
ncbi:acyltransferase family protein [Candidatus Saccharibacteria bacterium]|nr:acyltransferase family protein [Candidatus Saccharibacteria bacterium]